MTTQDAQLARQFEGCLSTAARRLDRAIKARYDESLSPLGLKSTQATLLVFIAGSDNPRAADLVAPMGIDQTTLSRNIERLINMGLVRADPEPDARSKRLSLTPAGRRKMKAALPLWQHAQKEMKAILGGTLSKSLTQAAARV